MNLRDLKIGARFGLGFGVILASASAMLIGAMVSNASSRGALLQTLQVSAAQEDQAVAMRHALLSSAVAVRNMGLQTQVEAVQKDEAEAKKERSNYLSTRTKLEATELDADERAVFKRLGEIDTLMEKHFKEAVDLAAQFNTEQAGAVITGKIDPLLNQANAELAKFIKMQKEHTAEATERANDSNRTTERTITAAGILLLALAALTAWRLTVSITRPLQTAVDAAARVAKGDLASAIELSGRDEATLLLSALRDMRDSLARMVSEVRMGANAIDGASTEIAQGNSDLSSRTESQASALEQTASSVEHLTSTVKQNAQNAAHAQELSQGAARRAEQGHEVVSKVIGTMSAINDNSRKIGDITSVINSIAFQTNILALNAAVEAARAGEHGRGFAVVASEVRTLSQRTTQAAKEIETLIRSAVTSTQAGSDMVDEAGRTMGEVMLSVRKVADIISEISAASREQTSGIEEVNLAIADIDRTTQQNAALVEEAAAAAESLRGQTHRLTALVSAFEV
ncbi:MAG: HAMP domain-containing protein [Burkholderiaceae bacterium]|nr:HAMP domain-containing protein [Burkholderiaceae bacterium]